MIYKNVMKSGMENDYFPFFKKEIQLAIPIKSIIISEISIIRRIKTKITAKEISRCKSRQI